MMNFERSYSIYLILIVSLSSLRQAKSCQRTELDKVDGVCALSLECDRVISFDHTTFDCIKTEKWVNNYHYYDHSRQRYGYTETTYSDFVLYVTVQNADDEHDIFAQIKKTDNIEEIRVDEGYMNAIPQKVFQLKNVKKVEIINNILSVIDLNSFSALPKVTTIILQNDRIKSLDMTTKTLYSLSRSIQEIDLSQNLLESIPNTCFSLYPEMKYLNLSHNMIRSFDILTFEGVLSLRTLDVSFNMLFEIGSSFTRFMTLNKLYLQNNNLTRILDYNLNTLIKVQILNLSSNFIESIETKTFKSLSDLEYLDMGNNKIEKIAKTLFEKNSNLQSLILTNNHINHIEDRAFDGCKITEFNIKNNYLNETIEKDTLKGIHVARLDLSDGLITSLGNECFKYMSEDLSYVNVSSNKITSISYSAFDSLELLSTLDLSHNLLGELTFDTSSLNNLTIFYARNNSIKMLTKSVFDNLVSLNELDLSHNKIDEVEIKCFMGLKKVETLLLGNNPFINSLQNNTFEGLISLKTIDLSNIRTSSFLNGSFSGLPNLSYINSSRGLLSTIEYSAFSKTGGIKILDLSHNMLEQFNVNMTSNQNIQEIYLNDNAIRIITNTTFSGLKELRILNLVNNAIYKMEVNALNQLHELSHLSLSSNTEMEIMCDSFNNLPNLYQVSLNHIKKKFTFQNGSAQIVNLELRFCGITDLNKLYIYNVKKLQELNLSNNAITTIDKFSFQDMPFLIKLDLSSNRINFIQPGSFIHVSKLKSLNLFGNNIQILQFGTFDGARTLSFVNLSSNALQRFDPRLLPLASNLALDNNNINKLEFKEFFDRNTKKLSIGGNPISCNALLELKVSNYSKEFESVLTTANLDFHSENVDGISCQSISKENRLILPNTNNTTSIDIRPAFDQFTNAIQDLRSSIELLKQNASQDESDPMKVELTKIVDSIQTMVKLSNQSQKNSDDFFQKSIQTIVGLSNQTQKNSNDFMQQSGSYLKNMENLNNNSLNYLKELISQLLNHTIIEKSENSEINQGIVSSKDSEDTRIEMKKMLRDEIEAIRDEFEKSFLRRGPANQVQITEKEIKDDKVLYFIAACLGIIIVLYIINVMYKLIKKRKMTTSRTLHGSARPFNEIEMCE